MRIIKVIKETLAGIWKAQKASLALPLKKAKTHYNYALMFVALGDLLGYPFQSTYYSRLLLVYWLQEIPLWRNRLLKEHDVLDKMSE